MSGCIDLSIFILFHLISPPRCLDRPYSCILPLRLPIYLLLLPFLFALLASSLLLLLSPLLFFPPGAMGGLIRTISVRKFGEVVCALHHYIGFTLQTAWNFHHQSTSHIALSQSVGPVRSINSMEILVNLAAILQCNHGYGLASWYNVGS